MGACKSKAAKTAELNNAPRPWQRCNNAATDFDGDRFVDLISLSMQRSPVFQTWSIGHIRNLAGITQERDFNDMEPIYKEKDDSEGIYFIKFGKVEITSIAGGSLEILSKGALFGELDVAAKQNRTQNAIARGAKTTLIRISRADYHQTMVTKDAVLELPTFTTLRDSVILMGLTESQLITLHAHCELEQYKPNEVIFTRTGPATEKLYLVHKGTVSISEIATAYDINSLWKLEWAGLNTYVILGKAGYFGDSGSDPSGVESNPSSRRPGPANGGDVPDGQGGHTVSAYAGPKGATVLSVSRTPLVSKAELRPVLERIVLNIQVRDQELRRANKNRPLDAWLAKVGQAPPDATNITPLGF